MTMFRRITWPGEKPGEIRNTATREYRNRDRSESWEGAGSLVVLDEVEARSLARDGIPADLKSVPLADEHLSAFDPSTAEALRKRCCEKRNGGVSESDTGCTGNRCTGSMYVMVCGGGFRQEYSETRKSASSFDRVGLELRSVLPPTIRLLLAIIQHSDLTKSVVFRLPVRVYKAAGISDRSARSRALKTLERLRAVRVVRRRGQLPEIHLNKNPYGLVAPWSVD